MKKLFVLFCLLALAALPAWAQKKGKLAAPNVTSIRAIDYSATGPEMGWFVFIEWDPVPGADSYAIRVVSRNGKAPRRVEDYPYPQGEANWVAYDSEPFVEHESPVKSIICCLDQKQRFKFRLRAIDLDNPDNVYGKATAPISFRLPKYGKAPVLPYTKRPTLEILG